MMDLQNQTPVELFRENPNGSYIGSAAAGSECWMAIQTANMGLHHMSTAIAACKEPLQLPSKTVSGFAMEP